MRPPDFISRLPRSLNSNRGHMKGTMYTYMYVTVLVCGHLVMASAQGQQPLGEGSLMMV